MLELGPVPCNLAGMIAGRRLLLEGRFVFFIDDDQPQMRRGGKYRAPRPDHNLHVSRRNLLPMAVPLGVAEVAVEHGDRFEAAAEPANRLRREADLGDEDDRLPAVADDFLNGADIDFGLP